jgi:phospholipid/cholesterol/gamma-HCH transport system substrate-binding protein
METRANYVLIGAFTLLSLLAALGFVLWLARIELDRTFDYYDILFDNVSGLSRGGEVRFNGVNVGQVVNFTFDEADPSLVRVRIEVRADTPMTEDIEARLQLQGVTGVTFVALSTTQPGAALLTPQPGDAVPTIRASPSPLDTLLEEAPDLLTESLLLIREMSGFASEENQAAVAAILANLASASMRFDDALDDFGAISSRVADATEVLAAFTDGLGPLADELGRTLRQAEDALAAAEGALGQAEITFRTADELLATRLPGLVDGAEAALGEIAATTRDTGREIAAAAAAATARLDQAETTIAAAETAIDEASAALATLGRTAERIDDLVAGDGTAMVAEIRAAVVTAGEALASVRTLAVEDMPGIAADIQATTVIINRVATEIADDVSRVGADITGFTGRLDGLASTAEGTLDAATATFRTANDTLGTIDQALFAAERTLAVAEGTFASATRVLDDDLDPVIADVRSLAASLEAALGDLAADLPGITADLRGAIGSANAAMRTLEGAVAGAASPVQAFATTGLPQFTRLLQEARTLVTNLERLTQRIERDPARFFLGSPSPEYRRP